MRTGTRVSARSAMQRAVVAVLSVAVASTTVAAEKTHLDADTAARLAMESSPLVASADARVEAVMGRADSANAERMPVIAIGAQYAHRSSVPEFSAPSGGPGEPPTVIFPNIQNTYALGVTASQLLYGGGRVNAGRRSTVLEVEATGADRTGLLAALRLQGRASFWQAVACEATLNASHAEITRAERLLDDVRALQEAGMAVAADRLAAEARVAAARVRSIRARADRDTSLAELRSTLGLHTSIGIELVPETATPDPPRPLASLVESARSNRAELQASRRRIEAAEERQEQARAGRRPTVQLTAGWDLARPNQRFLPLEDVWNDSWRVGLGASWTVFDGQRTAAAEATATAETAVLRADSKEVERLIDLEVETAFNGLKSALETTTATEATLQATAAREAAERDRFQAGMAPISNVLDAQSELATAEQNVIGARATAWIAAAVLERAVGQ